MVAKYEDWAHSDVQLFDHAHATEFACRYQPGDPEADIEKICVDAWAQILACSPDVVRTKGRFYMGLHLLRMVPFRLKVGDEQAIYALINGIRWIARALAN